MWPLLLKDGLALPYISCMLLFYAVSFHVFELHKTTTRKKSLVSLVFLAFLKTKLSKLLIRLQLTFRCDQRGRCCLIVFIEWFPFEVRTTFSAKY